MQWLLANLFLLIMLLIGSATLWLVGFVMWHLNLPPDDNPKLVLAGCALSIVVTYYLGKQLHLFLAKRI